MKAQAKEPNDETLVGAARDELARLNATLREIQRRGIHVVVEGFVARGPVERGVMMRTDHEDAEVVEIRSSSRLGQIHAEFSLPL